MAGAGIYIKTPSGLVAAATVPGEQGSQGPQSSLTPGTITTGAAGTNASATITGTGPVQTLNLTIPRGTPGSPTEFDLRGTGSPEGVLTAPVGTYYTDTALTNGAMRWAKKTGTGNTGWKVIEGNTGIRNTSSLIVSPWVEAATKATLHRVGSTVFAGLNADGSTNNALMMTLPVGFRPGRPQELWRGASQTWVSSAGEVYCITGASNFRLSVVWATSDNWPTTLPGVAA